MIRASLVIVDIFVLLTYQLHGVTWLYYIPISENSYEY